MPCRRASEKPGKGEATLAGRAIDRRETFREEMAMITALVLYDLPPSIGLEECRKHFTMIAPDFLKIPGFVRKQFICLREGGVAGGVYMWETRAAAEAFYSGKWRDGILARYGNEPRITYFETVALADKAAEFAGQLA